MRAASRLPATWQHRPARAAARPVARADRSARWVVALILATGVIRLSSDALTGLGIDESYTVATARTWQLGVFDHPPAAWWLCWGTMRLFGGDDPVLVRMPFVALFALSTWLAYRLGAVWSERAGLWSALVLNAMPMFGIAAGSWVLPDGPLDASLLGFMLCLCRALGSRARARWWIGTGLCAGLAMLSKYNAVLVLGGAALAMTLPANRRHLADPGPWLACAVGLLLFLPVLAWNARHHWVSLSFQGSRALGTHLHPLGPVVVLAGEALYVLPWIWLPAMRAFAGALAAGSERRLLAWCAAPSLALFPLVALWSHGRVLPHWAAPGYLLLCPLLGERLAAMPWPGRRQAARTGGAGAAAVVIAIVLLDTDVRWNWLRLPGAPDPVIDLVDWRSLRPQLQGRDWVAAHGPRIATIRWHDAGKLDYALGGGTTVFCLGDDGREYGILHPPGIVTGSDLVIVAPRSTLSGMRAAFGGDFATIEPAAGLTMSHAGRAVLRLPVYVGTDFHPRAQR